MKIVVIGGTGLIGSRLVDDLRGRGQEVTAAAPDTGVDTVTGEGLAHALTGADVVVDVSNAPAWEDAAVLEFFTRSTRNVLDAEDRAGVSHHVVLSIVGTDRVHDSGYLRAKRAQEELVERSPIPYTIVHATQFFEFVTRIADEATVDGTVRVPPVLIQPMAADDVAAALRRFALGSPRDAVVEVGGPEAFTFEEFVRQGLRAAGDARAVVSDAGARYFGAALEERSLVPGSGAELATTRFSEWLDHQPVRADR
jgi:uncharacterized protein YbjT (DUF2867 family)